MRVLATISDKKRLGIVLDTTTGEMQSIPVLPEFFDKTVTGRAACRPFGITWHQKRLFVANNRQILVFDNRLHYMGMLPVRLHPNVHQLAFSNGLIWAVSPWTNSLIGVDPDSHAPPIEFNLLDHSLNVYAERDASEQDDMDHFNSLLWAGTHLYVAAHAFGSPSFINVYDSSSLRLNYVTYDAGFSIHGLAKDQAELFWISTGTAEVRSSKGHAQPLFRAGYARGLAVTNQCFVVGVSTFLSRDDRFGGDAWIQIIDRNKSNLIREFHLPDSGSINDLRIIDTYDYAHQVQPFINASKIPE